MLGLINVSTAAAISFPRTRQLIKEILLNTAKDDKGPQIDVLNTAKYEKGP